MFDIYDYDAEKTVTELFRCKSDNIVAAIINSMLNSGVEEKMKKAYEVMSKSDPCSLTYNELNQSIQQNT